MIFEVRREEEVGGGFFNPGRGDQIVATGANPWLLRQSHRTPGGVTEAVDVGLGDRCHVAGRGKRMRKFSGSLCRPLPGLGTWRMNFHGLTPVARICHPYRGWGSLITDY